MLRTFTHTKWSNGIVLIDWDLGNRCNLDCWYCPQGTKGGNFSNPGIDTIISFAERMLDHYDGLNKLAVISFGASGEPTAIDWFPDLLRFLHNRVGGLELRTNMTCDGDWWTKNGQLLRNVHGTIHYGHTTLRLAAERILLAKENVRQLSICVPMLPDQFDQQLEDISWFREHTDIPITGLPLMQNLYAGGEWINYTHEQKLYLFGNHQDQAYQLKSPSIDDPPAIPMSTMQVQLNEHDDFRCFTGWLCHAGLDTLVIDSRGYVRKGWCAQLTTGQQPMTSWHWDSTPQECKMLWCRMHHDLLARKIER